MMTNTETADDVDRRGGHYRSAVTTRLGRWLRTAVERGSDDFPPKYGSESDEDGGDDDDDIDRVAGRRST